MSGDSRQCELTVRPHTLDQTDVQLCCSNCFSLSLWCTRGQSNPPAICTRKLRPDGAAGTNGGERCDVRSCYNEERGKQKGVSTLKVILHSLYEEHAVSFLLFLWCKTAPGFDLKDNWKGDFHQAAETQNSMTESSEEHVGFRTFLSCPPPPPMPGIRNRPPACTSRGMIFF